MLFQWDRTEFVIVYTESVPRSSTDRQRGFVQKINGWHEVSRRNVRKQCCILVCCWDKVRDLWVFLVYFCCFILCISRWTSANSPSELARHTVSIIFQLPFLLHQAGEVFLPWVAGWSWLHRPSTGMRSLKSWINQWRQNMLMKCYFKDRLITVYIIYSMYVYIYLNTYHIIYIHVCLI